MRKRHRARTPASRPEGKNELKFLSQLAESYSVVGVYSSNFKRTMETAQPLAKKNQLEIHNEIHPMNYAGLWSDIEKKYSGKTVFVVGHSNTVPGFINHVLGDKQVAQIQEKDYSNLFVLSVGPKGKKLESFKFEPGQTLKLQNQ